MFFLRKKSFCDSEEGSDDLESCLRISSAAETITKPRGSHITFLRSESTKNQANQSSRATLNLDFDQNFRKNGGSRCSDGVVEPSAALYSY